MHLVASCTYHNVGQGLFFSGKLELDKQDEQKEFNFIYDCGSESLAESQLKNRIDNFIETLPEKNRKRFLDLLIISHFHSDHINGLDYLLDKAKVDTVVIPYLSPVEILLYAIVNSRPPFPPYSYYEFLANPFEYLLEKGVNKIIVIGRGDDDGYRGDDFVPPDVPMKPNEKFSFNYEKQGDLKGNEVVKKQLEDEYGIQELIDKDKIIPKSHYGYSISLGVCLFRFFNARKSIKNFEQKLNKLKKCIANEFGIENLSNSILRNESILNELRKKRNNKFRKCYKESFGNDKLNLTSLVLYNLLLFKNEDCYCKIVTRLVPLPYHFYFPYRRYYIKWLEEHCHNNKCGHFLTGDAELKNNKVFKEFKKHYKRVLDKSLIFQLPHHGSKENWNSNIIQDVTNNEIFVASAGINSKYNHPSWSVFWEIATNYKLPIFINEQNWFEFHIRVD